MFQYRVGPYPSQVGLEILLIVVKTPVTVYTAICRGYFTPFITGSGAHLVREFSLFYFHGFF